MPATKDSHDLLDQWAELGMQYNASAANIEKLRSELALAEAAHGTLGNQRFRMRDQITQIAIEGK